jgi:hypothetical protein
MLDTVLDIGRVLRKSPTGLKHHRFIKRPPLGDDKLPFEIWTIKVDAKGTFDFSKREPLKSETRQQNLYYLNYKQSDADSTKKYIFGDVFRVVTKTGDDGNYKLGDISKGSWMAVGSFERGEQITVIETELVTQFRYSFRKQLKEIEGAIAESPGIYLHFDFEGKDWHQLAEIEKLNENLIETFFRPHGENYVMSAFLFKSLSADAYRLPGFTIGNEHRVRTFTDERQALDLLYAVDYASRSTIRTNDIKVVILPRGRDLTAPIIERFFERAALNDPASEQVGEEQLKREAEPDLTFAFIDCDEEEKRAVLQFDFIFSKAGGTKPDIDMIELSGVERSKLDQINRRIIAARNIQYRRREDLFTELIGSKPQKPLRAIRVLDSLNHILADVTSAKKKYQRHVLSILPKIYCDTYYNDPLLLPSLIRTVESNIRAGSTSFNLLKFDYSFLISIQINGERKLMELTESPSFRAGALLGRLAKPLAYEISLFEKNYVGHLSRRIGTLPDVVRLANELREKLVMHGKLYPSVREASTSLSSVLSECARYNKDECAFGFFESYFTPFKNKESDAPDNEQPTEN